MKESLIELEHAADLAKATGDKRLEVASLVIQAAVYAELNKRDEFERLTSTLLETVDALGIADMQVKSREILAKSHLKLNQPQKALPLFEEAIALSQKFDIQAAEAEALQELSGYYERQGKFEQALACFKKAVEMQTNSGQQKQNGNLLCMKSNGVSMRLKPSVGNLNAS